MDIFILAVIVVVVMVCVHRLSDSRGFDEEEIGWDSSEILPPQ